MNLPLDTDIDNCAFTIRTDYHQKVYVKNLGTGGGHYPATSVITIYQL